jgi:hypothetical protein
MPQNEVEHEIEIGFDGKPLKPVRFVTGKTHRITLKVPVLQLNHLYHDDVPVAGAEFEVELEDGNSIRGHLDDSGQAEVRGMRSRPVRVRYGPDPKPYEIVDDGTNPAYIAHFTKSDADSLSDPNAKRGPQPPDVMAFGIEAVDWIWGTVKGGFNQKQTISQIVVDALIGMIPLVGDLTAVRDILAILIGMANDSKKRESKLEWLALVVMLFAIIPVIGGAIKGVGKLLLTAGKEAAEASKQIEKIVAILNRPGVGNARKWVQELNLESYGGELLGRWRELTRRLDMVFDSMQSKLKGIIAPGMLDSVGKLKLRVQELAQKGEAMIPDALKELNERLKAAQRQVYNGDWHDIPKSLKSSTREVEARLIDVPGGKKWNVENMHFPQNGRESFLKRDDWPDLSGGDYVKVDANDVVTYKVIPCFSGPMRAVKIPPGQKIYRIVDENSRVAGEWWVYAPPETGKEWREGLAVLDSWNKDGFYVELTVPESGLWAWEGKAASQVENNLNAVATMGQYLPGGYNQLFIDMKHPNNAHSLEALAKKRDLPIEKILEKKPTEWMDAYNGLHVPKKNSEADFLGPFEVESKSRLKATTLEKSNRKKRQQE